MKWSYAAASLALFAISILFLFSLTYFESLLVNTSLTVERLIGAFFLVLPGVIGVVFGVMSLLQKETKRWMAIAGILLNGIFASFNLLVLSFAG